MLKKLFVVGCMIAPIAAYKLGRQVVINGIYEDLKTTDVIKYTLKNKPVIYVTGDEAMTKLVNGEAEHSVKNKNEKETVDYEKFTVKHKVIDDEPDYVYEVYEYRFKNWDTPYHEDDEGVDICVYPDRGVVINTYFDLYGAEVDDEYLEDITNMVGAAIVHADKLRNEAK